MTFWGLSHLDAAVIVGYFVLVTFVGFGAARKVADENDYFLGGRRFGRFVLTMHWICTGTHSEMAVQVSGATARLGLGGIWYQWMYLFSTPFYWLIAPITRRLRVVTTGDFFRIRYSRALETVYSIVGLTYFVLSIAMLLRGAGAAIAGATGGQVPTTTSVIVLSCLFATYITAGGLVAAVFTDLLQGVLIVVLSIMLVPAGLAKVGGFAGLHNALSAEHFAITAPPGSLEGDVWFVLSMSILGLVGVIAQPHVMSATGSGKSEREARVGMVVGNFAKRVLTIAWAVTGLIAVVAFPKVLGDVEPTSLEAQRAGETLFGHAVHGWLGDGWRGLMIACLIAGVTSAETFMVVGSAIITRNLYMPVVRARSDRHYLMVGRFASAGLLALSMVLAFTAESVTALYLQSVQVIGLMGPAVWLGVTWRRANPLGVWLSLAGGVAIWILTSTKAPVSGSDPLGLAQMDFNIAERLSLHDLTKPEQIGLMLSVQFGLLIAAGLLGRKQPDAVLDPFFARLLTPVGSEALVAKAAPAFRESEAATLGSDVPAANEPEAATLGMDARPANEPESATLGMENDRLDYEKASAFGIAPLRQLGIEAPKLTASDIAGFLISFAVVGLLILSLGLIAQVGA